MAKPGLKKSYEWPTWEEDRWWLEEWAASDDGEAVGFSSAAILYRGSVEPIHVERKGNSWSFWIGSRHEEICTGFASRNRAAEALVALVIKEHERAAMRQLAATG